MRVLVGISGASGAAFAVDFLERCPGEKYLVISDWGKALLKDELDMNYKELAPYVEAIFRDTDLAAPFSSGTNRYDAYIILPCSASTMAKIALGIGDTLLTRAAQVALKERMRLILCLRETPLSTGMLENALKISREGGIIAPVMPPFYNKPKNLEEMIAGYTKKLLPLVGADAGPGWRDDLLGPEGEAAREATEFDPDGTMHEME